MKKTFILLVSAFILVLTACEKQENELAIQVAGTDNLSTKVGPNLNFAAHLSGSQEVPANDSQAAGQVIFHLSQDGLELHYKLIVANIENVTASHIHVAQAGVNGPVTVFLFAGPLSGQFNGILAEGVITSANLIGPLSGQPLEALIDLMEQGSTYVNVHTSQFPGGEIRGQI